ncbi:MAG TPA: ABC transporter substrate-binding protein [Methylibium sp.]
MSGAPTQSPDLVRRALTLGLAASPLLLPKGALAAGSAAPTMRVAQLLDMSAEQQDLSRDYSTGVRLGLAEFNQANGGRNIQITTLNTDGSPASLKEALDKLREDASICALLGTVGDHLAVESIAAAHGAKLSIAHVAPWMADSRHDADDEVFALFASREMQIRHALKSLEVMGVSELGVIYTDAAEQKAIQDEVNAMAARLKLRIATYVPAAGEDLTALPARMGSKVPAILLFLGGTLELAQFTQALSRQNLQRYVVSLADVDVPTLMQVGTGKAVPLILTQVVPNPQTSSLPVVRNYRAGLKRLFDESPSQVSLAGYLAARYAAQVLLRVEPSASRARVLAEFQKRPAADLGGFNISFAASQRRGSTFVTQTLLGPDGRLIG